MFLIVNFVAAKNAVYNKRICLFSPIKIFRTKFEKFYYGQKNGAHFEELIEFLKIPIMERRLIKFYYESKSGKEEWRTIRPICLFPRVKIFSL